MAVVYTGGTFDLIHSGHIKLFAACRKIAGVNGRVVVSLNSDEFVEEYKGKPPIMTFAERKAVLMGCKDVDEVILNIDGTDSKPSIIKVKPNFIVVGDDWARKDYYTQMQFTREWLDSEGIQLCYVPYTPGISTTELKKRIIALS